jgi:hypothetical protein
MRSRVFFRKHPVLLGAMALVAGVAASGTVHFFLSGEFVIDGWGLLVVPAVLVALGVRSEASK